MADIFGIVKSKLTSTDARALPSSPDVVREQQRILHFKKLYDYYVFDRENILNYVADMMKGTFKPKAIKKMQFPLYNITRKIIDQLAVAYLEPAERYTVAEKSAGEFVNSEEEAAYELYQEILQGSNINSASKSWNRLAKLLDTVYVGVMYRDGKIEYDLFPPHSLAVVESEENYLEPQEVRYERSIGDDFKEFVWTKDTYDVLDADGKRVEGFNQWNGVNKYGLIPLVPCRLRVPEDHWGEGDTELVNLNEKVNIINASSFFNAIMQSHGILFATNLRLGEQLIAAAQKGSLENDGSEGEFQTGPDAVFEANQVSKDDVQPDLKFVNPDPSIDSNIKLIDWMIKTLAVSKGLSASSVSTEANESSGVAKQVDLLELRERRRDDIEFLRPFEKRLFEVTRRVWNVNNPGNKLSEEAVFGIDFVEPQPIMDENQKLSVMEKKMGMGLASPVDMMKDEDEGIDEEQALDYILRNLELNNKIMQAKMAGTVIEETMNGNV